jgi:TusA-related sulfurtransferase
MLNLKLQEIDARGRSCPEPVLMTKKGVERNPEGVMVTVDNATARENISRFGKNSGYKVRVEQNGQDYVLILEK